MNSFIVGGKSLQQPGETVTGVYGAVHHVSVFRYCGVSGARCWANPLLAAGNLALVRNADNYTKYEEKPNWWRLRGESGDLLVEKSFGQNGMSHKLIRMSCC